MRFNFALLAVVSAPLLVAAHDEGLAERAYNMRRHLMERQGPSSSTSPPTSPVATSPPSSLPPSGTPSSVSGPVNSTVPTVVLASTNPTAVPLSLINSSRSSATKSVPAPTAGSSPPISNAPPLPDVSKIRSSDYPPLDAVPPVDSDQVKQWIAEVMATGIVIPNLSQTVDGGCAANAAVVTDPTRCWWSCTGCTSKTDITECPSAMDWGLTYDDGPGYYTPNLLEYLESKQLKSTFFVVGSRVLSFPHVVQYEYMTGHQIAVHTWSHHSLTQLSNEQIIAELGWSKKVIKDVLGITPNMMRPPFGDIDNRVRAISIAMGLTPVIWTRISPQATFDTDDFNIQNGKTSANQVLQNWVYILGNVTTMKNGFIVLEHDLFEDSVEVATGYILPDALAHNPPFSIKPVVSCQTGLSPEDAYIETNHNSTHPPALAAAIAGGGFSTTSVKPSATGATKSTGSGVGISLPVSSLVLMVLTGMFAAVSII